MSLSAEEIERYARHIVLQGVGGPGQQKLKAARVLVIGAGGLGSPVLQYLAAAGVGTLGIVDDDEVSLSNLQRQVLHGTPDIGAPKVESAAQAIRDAWADAIKDTENAERARLQKIADDKAAKERAEWEKQQAAARAILRLVRMTPRFNQRLVRARG